MTKKEYFKKSMHLSIGSVLGCMLFLLSTDPDKLPVAMLLIMPILLSLVVVGFTRMSLLVFTDQAVDRVKQLSLIIGAGALIVSLLSSLSQLGIQDMVLSFALIGGLVFYLRRFQTQSS